VTEPRATVIIVDDDPSVRRSLRRLLGAAGYEVSTFASAEEFLGIGDIDSPACLVVDVRMPGKTGFDLKEILVARGIDVPVIFISGHDDPETEVKAMRAGAVRFLAKPMDAQALLDAVDHAIRMHRQRVVEAVERDPL
jgi:FixJ family two-component response regulator